MTATRLSRSGSQPFSGKTPRRNATRNEHQHLAPWASGPISSRHRTPAMPGVLPAVGQSLPMAGIGLLLALVAALALAVLSVAFRSVSTLVMPIALILQTMPLVAPTPMIVLIFGRGVTTTLVVAVTVTFFPAFITIARGLTLVPKPALDLLDIYGASRGQKLLFASLPTSLPYLCGGARLVAPAALLGVMTWPASAATPQLISPASHDNGGAT